MSTQNKVKSKPILFSGPMVRAILEGRKEQMRRVVKPQPISIERHERFQKPGFFPLHYFGELRQVSCPYGQPGDRLWVRETWRPFHDESDINYRSDDSVRRFLVKERWFADDWIKDKKHSRLRWRPSIHMPRWASRITLEVLRVWVERLQEINEADAEAEGFHPYGCGGEGNVNTFHRTWDSLNAKRGFSWESNPWIWVIEFRRVLQ